ncbi:MAG: M28 family peptidase [Bdellovibrio sp.]|nr:M28 family peptidase [Bdellovibrio sp.]
MSFLSKKFPNRVTWSPARIKAGNWLKSELAALGYTPRSLRFTEVIAGKHYTNLENIYVEKRGSKHPDEIIAVVAHYDITDTTVEGAMDDGSGVGLVLELARVFAKQETDRTLLFLLTDSEEFGAFWGARAFAQRYENSDRIIAALNFDFVTPEKQTKILTLCDGLKTGFTPLWLREMALDSIRSVGTVEALDLSGLEEFVIRAMQIPPADHGALLAEGIPAFNWVGQTDNFAHIMSHYHHTPYDVAEALRPESFGDFGLSAERLIRSINSLSKIPTNFRDSFYWKVSENFYIPGLSALFLQILFFIPFLAYSTTKFSRTLHSAPKIRVLEVIANEMKFVGILLGSLLLGYGIILLLPAFHIITAYENFPATQKSLLLYTPNFIAILLVCVAIIGVYWIFRRTFSEKSEIEQDLGSKALAGHAEIRHALLATLLTLVIFLAFLKNSYLAVLLLLPPAYFWTAIRNRKRPEDRLLNVLLLVGGSITFVALAVLMSTVFHVGVFYWYIFLAAAYGLISAYTVVLFFTVITVMIRLFKSFVL